MVTSDFVGLLTICYNCLNKGFPTGSHNLCFEQRMKCLVQFNINNQSNTENKVIFYHSLQRVVEVLETQGAAQVHTEGVAG